MMLYRKLMDDEGEYVDADWKRCTLQIVRGSNHPELFTPFPTMEACLASWQMVPFEN